MTLVWLVFPDRPQMLCEFDTPPRKGHLIDVDGRRYIATDSCHRAVQQTYGSRRHGKPRRFVYVVPVVAFPQTPTETTGG